MSFIINKNGLDHTIYTKELLEKVTTKHLAICQELFPEEEQEVYDLIAARVITTNEKKYCYLVLSVIHDIWTPVPERFKDWIGSPRGNLYQSLHTSVIGEGGQSFEVQIRTEEMQYIAEEGVAAHWRYKDNKLGVDDDTSIDELRKTVEKLLLPLVETTEENQDSEDFIESLKLDLYPKEVYTFTPLGKVINLPKVATPIEFAYSIHSEVGDTCTGAKINGRIVPLRTKLQNGNVVEILTSPNSMPSRDWLNHVETSKARNRIRYWIAQRQRVDSIEMGRKLLEKENKKFGISSKKMFKSEEELTRVANEYGLGRAEDLLASVGYGKTLIQIGATLQAGTLNTRVSPMFDQTSRSQDETQKINRDYNCSPCHPHRSLSSYLPYWFHSKVSGI